ncbi:MAG: hypothetical protein ACJ75B_06360 [Flavisolibacter sp.]
MKYFLSFLFSCLLCFPFSLKAQRNINGLVGAEKAFAALSVSKGTRTAFLQFLDSTGIVFEKGMPVNGFQTWKSRGNLPGILNWHPQYAEISASGDLGYTTGPWTFQNHDSIAARGQYTTIWHVNENGEWKFLADMGVGGTPVNNSIVVHELKGSRQHGTDSLDMLDQENKFISSFSHSPEDAYRKYLSSQSILNRNGQLPATTSSEQHREILQTPASIRFTVLGHGFSAAGDLGYVYGSIQLNEISESYLHIWRRERSGWKLAVEVLRY